MRARRAISGFFGSDAEMRDVLRLNQAEAKRIGRYKSIQGGAPTEQTPHMKRPPASTGGAPRPTIAKCQVTNSLPPPGDPETESPGGST